MARRRITMGDVNHMLPDSTRIVTDVLYKGLERLFSVRIPEIAVYNDVELAIFGYGTDDIDGVQNNRSGGLRLVNSYQSLKNIIMIHDDGMQVQMVNQKDIDAIYEILEDYLEVHAKGYQNSPNIVSREADTAVDKWIAKVNRFLNDMFAHKKRRLYTNKYKGFGSAFDVGVIGKIATTAANPNRAVPGTGYLDGEYVGPDVDYKNMKRKYDEDNRKRRNNRYRVDK